jgi:hypothetical protein
MDKRALTFSAIGLAVVLAGGWYAFSHSPSPANAPQAPYVVPPLTKGYSNDAYKFSLKMPENFDASEIAGDPDGTPYTLLLQDKEGNGIQILISPFPDDTNNGYTLTKEKIVSEVPDMKITDAQAVEVGQRYTGLAFKSDNAAFGGASREVWFVFRGNLYQISTYEQLDDLLKQIFSTWQFK